MSKLILAQLYFNSSSISTLLQLKFNFNSTSTQPQLNLNHKSITTSASTQTQPKVNLNLKSNPGSSQLQLNFSLNISLSSTSTITSTQYGCDIKATQSCFISKYLPQHWIIMSKGRKCAVQYFCPSTVIDLRNIHRPLAANLQLKIYVNNVQSGRWGYIA